MRTIVLDRVHNVRDFGGYAGRNGRLKRDLLFRSANHSGATDQDLAALRALGIEVIVDLRRYRERLAAPSKRWQPFEAGLIEDPAEPIHGEDDDAFRQMMRMAGPSVEAMAQYMDHFYRTTPLEPRYIRLFSLFFQELARGPGPILIHCAGGKDRTGLLAALTHHLVGVRRDDTLADYMLTNDESRYVRTGQKFANRIEEMSGQRPTEAFVRLSMSVSPELLQAAYDTFDAQFGGIDGYLSDALGITPMMRKAIEDHILE